jgi:hypothetical protein
LRCSDMNIIDSSFRGAARAANPEPMNIGLANIARLGSWVPGSLASLGPREDAVSNQE